MATDAYTGTILIKHDGSFVRLQCRRACAHHCCTSSVVLRFVCSTETEPLPKQQPNCANYGGLVCHLEGFVLRSCEGGKQVSVCSGVEI